MNHHSWLAIWAHPCSTSSHIPSAYRRSEHLRRLFGVLAKPRFCSHGKEWTSLLFLGRSEVNEVNDYIVILHIYIYIYISGWWLTYPSGKYNARKWSDHLHCSENAAIAVRAGLDSALWWSAHPLIQPDVIDARPVMIWTLPLTASHHRTAHHDSRPVHL